MSVVDEKPKKTPLMCSARLALAVMCFLACVNLYAQNSSLNLTLVCMLNHTSIYSHFAAANATPESHYGRCSVRNGSEAENKSDGEFEWGKETQGMILGAFFWGYCLPQLFYGVVAKKYGAKYVMLGGMSATTIGTLFTPLAAKTGYLWLVALRVFMGFTAGVVSPSLQALWSKWAPAEERTVLVGVSYAGIETGNVIAFALSGIVCDAAGWTTVFYMFGIASCVWCLLWLLLVSESPSIHPRISKEERKYIQATAMQSTDPVSLQFIPWKSMMTSVPLLAIVVAHCAFNFGMFLILTELPSYMSEVLRFDIKSNGLYSALPYLSVMLVVPFATAASDSLRKKNMISTGNVRKLMMSISLCGSAAFLVGTGYVGCDQTTSAVILFTVSSALGSFKNGGFLVNHGDIAPGYASITLGISNSIAVSQGFIAPLVASLLTENQTIDEWRRVFWVAAGVMVFGAIFYAIFASGEEQDWAKQKLQVEDKTRIREMEHFI